MFREQRLCRRQWQNTEEQPTIYSKWLDVSITILVRMQRTCAAGESVAPLPFAMSDRSGRSKAERINLAGE
jgi:hypothetical protein